MTTEIAIFAGVGIQSRHGDSGPGDTLRDKKIAEEFSHTHDFRGAEEAGNTRQRDMGCDQGDSQIAAGEAHGEIFNPGAAGEEFGLAGKIKSDLVHCALANRAGDDCLPLPRSEFLGGGFESGEGFPG